MTIEKRFLQKAIEDKNYVGFSHYGKSFKRVRPLVLGEYILKCDVGEFDISSIKKLVVLREKF